jgi:hypothetical protein
VIKENLKAAQMRQKSYHDKGKTVREYCWRLIIISKFICDLQAYKSPVVVKGPFFPRVVNPRYRIRGTNVWRKT